MLKETVAETSYMWQAELNSYKINTKGKKSTPSHILGKLQETRQ